MAMDKKLLDLAEIYQADAAQIIRDMCKLPAPSHHEELRAEYCRKWFVENGFRDVKVDEALNVIAPINDNGSNDITIVMAHTDTVFPDTEPMPFVEKDGFMHSPGVVDDTANLSVLMACSRYYLNNCDPGDKCVLFIANSCEEGLGNLKGTRQIMKDYGKRVKEFISFDSSCMNRYVVQAVGSHRYKVTVRTEGGHSFGAFGNRNAIHVLSSMICSLYTVKVPQVGNSRTTYNVGGISGGTSVNTIAQNAEMLYEYRSDNCECLEKMRVMFNNTIEMYRSMSVTVEVELLGERPCGVDIDEARLKTLQNRYLNALKDALDMEGVPGSSSTDCNIPLSMGIPAICFGVCRGSGCHTREEKLEVASLYDGCKLALQLFCNL